MTEPTQGITEQELADIEKRHASAERGWHLVTDDTFRYRIEGDGPTVIATFDGDSGPGTPSYMTEENAEFAARAYHDVPRLVGEVRRLQAALNRAADSDDPAEKLRAELEFQHMQMRHLQKEASGVLAALDQAKDDLRYLRTNTIPGLQREAEHHKQGKERWRDRALAAEKAQTVPAGNEEQR